MNYSPNHYTIYYKNQEKYHQAHTFQLQIKQKAQNSTVLKFSIFEEIIIIREYREIINYPPIS